MGYSVVAHDLFELLDAIQRASARNIAVGEILFQNSIGQDDHDLLWKSRHKPITGGMA